MDKLREPGRLTAERVHGIKGAVDDRTPDLPYIRKTILSA